MLHGLFARICPRSYAFFLLIAPSAHIVSSYGLLQQRYADDTQLYVAIFKDNYDIPVAKLELCLSILHTWFCYNGLALNPDKSEAIVLAPLSAHVLFQLPSLSMSPESLSRFPIRSGVSELPLTLDSYLMHTSHHFQSLVSITSEYSVTSFSTFHCTAPRTLPVLSSAVASITPIRRSWSSRLRTFLDFNVCKARSLMLSHISGDA